MESWKCIIEINIGWNLLKRKKILSGNRIFKIFYKTKKKIIIPEPYLSGKFSGQKRVYI